MQNFSRVCARIDFIVFNKWVWVEWFMTSLICSFVCCGFVTDCQRGRLLGHMCFSCYRTYVMILCNWLILWQNVLYSYLYWCMFFFHLPLHVLFLFSLYTYASYYLYVIYYSYLTQRCLNEFCLKCFRNTGCQSLLVINSLLAKFFKSLC